MPRNVRNFWLTLNVDGKQTRVETGPQAKEGGFSLVILMRDEGSITRAMEIDGRVNSDGQIVLTAETCRISNGGETQAIEVRTRR